MKAFIEWEREKERERERLFRTFGWESFWPLAMIHLNELRCNFINKVPVHCKPFADTHMKGVNERKVFCPLSPLFVLFDKVEWLMVPHTQAQADSMHNAQSIPTPFPSLKQINWRVSESARGANDADAKFALASFSLLKRRTLGQANFTLGPFNLPSPSLLSLFLALFIPASSNDRHHRRLLFPSPLSLSLSSSL